MSDLFSQRVVVPDGSIQSAVVSVQNGVISSVTLTHDCPDHALNLGDKLLAPAWINMHTHLPMSAFRAIGGVASLAGNVVEDLFFRLERALTADDIRAFTRVGAWECLLNGTGCVWEHYYGGRSLAEGIADTGLSAAVGCALQDLAGPGVDAMESQWDAMLALDEDSALAARGIVPVLAPHATDTVSDALWDRIAAHAESAQCPVHVHVAQSLEEVERSWERCGRSPLSMLQSNGWLDAGPSWALVHMIYVSHEELRALDRQRHVPVYCPYSQVQFELPAPVRAWMAAGLDVGIATDAGVCNDTMNVQQDLRLAAGAGMFGATLGPEMNALLRSGSLEDARAVRAARVDQWRAGEALADPSALLKTVWHTPGRLHPKLKLGQIAPGYRANLAVWDLQHPSVWPALDPLRALTYGDVSPALWGLMVSGQWTGTPGDHQRSILQSTTYLDHVTEARERLTAMLGRAGIQLASSGR